MVLASNVSPAAAARPFRIRRMSSRPGRFILTSFASGMARILSVTTGMSVSAQPTAAAIRVPPSITAFRR